MEQHQWPFQLTDRFDTSSRVCRYLQDAFVENASLRAGLKPGCHV